MHPLKETENLIYVNNVDLVVVLVFINVVDEFIDDLLRDPGLIGELRNTRTND